MLVAERAAPALVPRIEAETGLDLTTEQLQAVLDMAGRLDAEDLDELARTVRDREARGQALREVTSAAAAGAMAATGLDDDVPVEAGPAGQLLQEPPPPAPPVVDPDEDRRNALGVQTEPVRLDRDPEPTVDVAPAPEPRPFESIFDTLPDVPGWEPSARRDAETGTTPGGDGDGEAPSTAAPAVATRAPDETDLTTRVRAARQPLVEALRAARTNAHRLQVLRGAVDQLVEMDRPGRLAVVDAVPDGWARRRAIEDLLRAQVLPAAEVPVIIGRTASPAVRAWLCASAIEADMLRVEDAMELVDDRAAARLRRRYA